MSLTDTAIKRFKPSDKCTPNRPDKYSDDNGLWLAVRSTGTKVFFTRYTVNQKRGEITLGKYPALSLAQARLQNNQIQELAKQGIDPKTQRSKEALISFDSLAQKWLAHQQTRIADGTFKRDQSAYNRHIKPILGHRDVYAITLSHIMLVHDKLAQANKTSLAHRAISWVSAIFNHAIIKGYVPNLANPLPQGIHKELVEHSQTHYPRIKITQLPRLLQDIDNSNCSQMVKLMFYFMAYTFVRTKEVRFMRWGEIDWQACLWHIPAERMKMRKPHIVPLAPQAIEILQTIKAWGFSSEFVFFSHHGKGEVFSNNVLTSALKKMGYLGKMTGHGFRGLACTSLYEMQYNPKAIELQLSHVVGGKVERAYNDATMLPTRTQMMNEWANVIDEVKGGDFSTYKARLTNDNSLELFLRALDYKENQIRYEMSIHQAEMAELASMS
jgi:integrase